MNRIFLIATFVFDPLHYFWESERTKRNVAGLLIAVFLLSLGAIELKRQGIFLPICHYLPSSNHFFAINVAFTLVLIIEVLSLVFTVPCSLSKSIGKQFEILALILLRSSFKKLIELPEPISLAGHTDTLLSIATDGLGALIIFFLLGIFRVLMVQDASMKKGEMLFRYVAAKKIVALALLCIFSSMGIYQVWHIAIGRPSYDFFSAFYTVLIFSDILLVLIAQRFLPRFRSVFRNSGFALSTLFIRLALTAPAYWDVLLGTGSVIFAVLLTLVYNTFYAPAVNMPRIKK